MSHLDQAFIRAYARETAGLKVRFPAAATPAKPAAAELPPSLEPLPLAPDQSPIIEPPSVEELYAPQVAPPKRSVASSPVPAPHALFFASRAKQQPHATVTGAEQTLDFADDAPPETTVPSTPSVSASTDTYFRLDRSQCAPLSSFLVETEPLPTEPLSFSDIEAAAQAESSAPEAKSDEAHETFIDRTVKTGAEQVATSTPIEAIAAFEPAFEVQRFAWPSVCGTILDQMGDKFEQLTGELLAAVGRGQNIIAFTGCQSKAGSTSLLLCVARWLALAHQRVALVDGDFDQARLAERLGLAPQAGWIDAIERDEPLTEVLIESIEDRVALLPLAQAVDQSQYRAIDWFQRLQLLRHHHDLVLIDSGCLDGSGAAWSCPTQIGQGVDATVLVMDMRATDHDTFATARARLDRAQLAWWGAIENFAPAA